LQLEDKIGTMLSCNVIVQEYPDDGVEVSAVDPVASMQANENRGLAEVAKDVQSKLRRIVNELLPLWVISGHADKSAPCPLCRQ
jgi:hypothetical protein